MGPGFEPKFQRIFYKPLIIVHTLHLTWMWPWWLMTYTAQRNLQTQLSNNAQVFSLEMFCLLKVASTSTVALLLSSEWVGRWDEAFVLEAPNKSSDSSIKVTRRFHIWT